MARKTDGLTRVAGSRMGFEHDDGRQFPSHRARQMRQSSLFVQLFEYQLQVFRRPFRAPTRENVSENLFFFLSARVEKPTGFSKASAVFNIHPHTVNGDIIFSISFFSVRSSTDFYYTHTHTHTTVVEN